MEKTFVSELNAVNGAIARFKEQEEALEFQIKKLDESEENTIELETLKR